MIPLAKPLTAARGSVARIGGAPDRTRLMRLMDKTVEFQHFVFAIVLTLGLLLLMWSKSIDSTTGASMLSILAGYYLGKGSVSLSTGGSVPPPSQTTAEPAGASGGPPSP